MPEALKTLPVRETSRRSVLAAGAWSVPVIALAMAAPATAASTAVNIAAVTPTASVYGGETNTAQFLVSTTGDTPLSGQTVDFSSTDADLILGAASAVSDGSGLVTVTFVANRPDFSGTITATAGAATGSVNVTVLKPLLTVTPDSVSPTVSNVFTLSGRGYVGAGAVNGAYIGVWDKAVWSGNAPLDANAVVVSWLMPMFISGGAWTSPVTVPANVFNPANAYHAASSAAHGLAFTNRTLDAFADITLV